MIVINLGSDTYRFNSSKNDFEELSRKLRLNIQEKYVSIPVSMTGKKTLIINANNISSFYYEDGEANDTLGKTTGVFEEVKRGPGRPKAQTY